MSDASTTDVQDSHNMSAAPGAEASGRTPVISLIGWSGSGKTTFLEQVVRRLSQDGVRVGVIKHHAHDTSIDVEGKDSWRYEQAGASPVIVSSTVEYSIIRKAVPEKTLSELAALIADECDVILTEGYRHEADFIIEFQRKAHRDDRIFEPEQTRAFVSDNEVACKEAEAVGVPTFGLDDVDGVVGFIVSQISCENGRV